MAFEVRSAECEKTLKEIGDTLRAAMPKGYGFVLLIAEYGEAGNLFYASNCERHCVANMMREFISKHEPN